MEVSAEEKNKYILIRDLAPRTPYTQGYLSLLARRGKVDAIKVGKSWHVNPKSLEAYMATTDSPASVEAEKGLYISREPHAELASLSASAQAVLYPPQFVAPRARTTPKPIEQSKHVVQVSVPRAQQIAQVSEPQVDSLADALDRHFKSRGRLSRFNYFAKKTVVIPWAATAVLVATLTALFLFVDGFSFGKVDAMALRIKQAVEDSQTLQGYMPGTHANEVLLLDDEGKISIYGHIETQGQIRSLAGDGMAPLVVDSTVTVENLSADYVDGFSHEEFTLAFVTERGNVTTERVYLDGGASVGGTLHVSGATKLLSYLEVYGELHALSNAIVEGTLTVNDDVTLKDGLAVGGEASFLNSVVIDGSAEVKKNFTALSAVIKRSLTVEESAYIEGNFGVGGDTSIADLEADDGDFSGDISANDAQFSGSLTVTGNASFSGVSLSGSGTSTFSGNLSVAGDGYFGGDVDIVGNLEVGSISLGTLGVTGTSTARRYLASDLGGSTSAAYSFSGDIDTGIYSSGADTLNFTTGGTTRFTLDSSGNAAFTGTGSSTIAGNLEVAGDGYYGGDVQIDGDLAVGNLSLSELTVTGTSTSRRYLASDLGNATAAAYSFSGDTDTGVFSAGADTLNFTTGGTNRLTLDSSGNAVFAGTGTSTAAGNLDLEGDFNATRYDITGTGTSTNAGNIAVSGAAYFGGNVQIVGNLDVGSLNLSDLTVTGTSTSRRFLASDLGNETAAAYSFSGDTNTGVFSAGPDILNFTTAGVTRVTIDASGNVAFTGTGTSTVAGNLDLAGDINATRFDISGSGTSTMAGHLYTTGNVEAIGSMFVIGDSINDIVYINSYIQSDLVPFPNATYDLGTSARYWDTLYVDTINANTIAAASTSISGTVNEDFTINSDNATADTEDMSLIFYRGTVVPNAVIEWDSTLNHFNFNHPVHVQNDSSSISSNPTFHIQGQINQTADILNVSSSTGDILFTVTSEDRVGVATSAPGATFAVEGSALITGNTNIGGTLDVAGSVTFTGLSTFSDLRAATLNATTSSLGSATIYGVLTATAGLSTLSDLRAATLNATSTTVGTLSVFGNTSLQAATTTNLAISGITGSTQCLQADTNGTVTGAGSQCNSGAAWHELFTDALTPTSTTAGIFVNASSTFDSTLRVNGNTELNGILSVTNTATSSIAGGLTVDTDTLVVNDNEGRVGIGTTSPNYLLSVNSSNATDNLFQVATTTNQGVFAVNSSGNVGIGSSNPIYKLEVRSQITGGVSSGIGLVLDSVAHGMTSLATTDAYGEIEPFGGDSGGLRVAGYTDTDSVAALMLRGVIGVTNPADSTAAVEIVGAKKNGTGLQALSARETVINVFNDATTLTTILGDGSFGIATTTPGGTYGEKLTVVGGAYITGDSILSDLRSSFLNATSATIDTLTINTSLTNTGTTTARRFLASDLGNATAAAFSFSGDPNTGLFAAGADALGLSTGGTSRLSINSSGDTTLSGFLAVSSVATTSIAGGLVVDTTTLVVNDNENRVGIGTANPSDKLHVHTTGANTVRFSGDSSGSLILEDTGNVLSLGAISFQGTGVTRVSIDASNDSGLGTLQEYNLDIEVGSKLMTFTSIGHGQVGIATTTPGGYFNEIFTIASTSGLAILREIGGQENLLRVGTSTDSDIFQVKSTGTVGLSTSTPSATLSVVGDIYGTGGIGVGVLNTSAGTLQTSAGAIIGSTLTATAGLSTLSDLRAATLNATSTTVGTLSVFGNTSLQAATTTNLAISGITGSTQCLQADTNGTVTGAGSQCNSGAAWHLLFTNALTPTSTTAGIFVNASSTFDSTLRVNGNTELNGILSVTNTATSSIAGGLTVDTDTLVVNDNEGRVGIGTASPLVPLDVIGTIGEDAIRITISSTDYAGFYKTNQGDFDDEFILRVVGNAGTASFVFADENRFGIAAGVPDATIELVADDTDDLLYLSSAQDMLGDLFNVQRTGEVGIATTTPGGTYGEKLTVVGSTYITGGATTTNLAIIGITGSTQCLQADTNGVVTGSGVTCGASEWLDAGAFVYPDDGDYAAFPYFTATSTTATSTIAHSLTVDSSTFFVNANENRVGIATTTPQSTFVADGTVELGRAGLGNILFHTTTQGGTPTLIGIGTSTPDADVVIVSDQTAAGTYLFTVATSSGNTVNRKFIIDSDGDILHDGSVTTPADYAEAFTVDGLKAEYEPGDIVSLSLTEPGKVQKSSVSYDDGLVGVYSTKPGIIGTLADDITDYTLEESNDIPVGLLGRVPVKVTTENGPIKVGDRITSSSLLGVGMRADEMGMVVGRALESYNGVGVSKIMVMVDPIWFSGNLAELINQSSTTSTSKTTIINETTIISQSMSTSTENDVPSVIDTIGDAMVNFWDVARETIASVADSLWNVSNTVIASASKLRIFSQDEDKVTYETYNVQSARREITISGTAELKRLSDADVVGARVAFDESFMAVIDKDAPLKVVVTPTSRIVGSLYVHEKQFYGFEVREQNGESEGATFDWIVIARAAGDYNEEEDPVVAGEQVDEIVPYESTDSQSSDSTGIDNTSDELTAEEDNETTAIPLEPTNSTSTVSNGTGAEQDSTGSTEPEAEPEISSEPLITPPASEPETPLESADSTSPSSNGAGATPSTSNPEPTTEPNPATEPEPTP